MGLAEAEAEVVAGGLGVGGKNDTFTPAEMVLGVVPCHTTSPVALLRSCTSTLARLGSIALRGVMSTEATGSLPRREKT